MLNPVGYFPGAKVNKAMDALTNQKLKLQNLKELNRGSLVDSVSSDMFLPLLLQNLANGFFLIKVISTMMFF